MNEQTESMDAAVVGEALHAVIATWVEPVEEPKCAVQLFNSIAEARRARRLAVQDAWVDFFPHDDYPEDDDRAEMTLYGFANWGVRIRRLGVIG
jgi:hypothetical protein